jgi:hypothetical protein
VRIGARVDNRATSHDVTLCAGLPVRREAWPDAPNVE